MRPLSVQLSSSNHSRFLVHWPKIFLAFFLVLVVGAPLAAQEPEFVSICNSCTSNQDFARAAVSEAPDPRPGDAQARIYPVYVVSTRRTQIEFFNVHVYREEGGISPFSTTNYSLGIVKTAYPAAPDPTIASAVLDAALIAEAFASELTDELRASEFSDVESAIDLLGPYDSPAGRLRNQMKADINDLYNSLWSRMVMNFSDLTSRLAGKFFGSDGLFVTDGFLTVRFPDGTLIKARIQEILEATDSNDAFSFELVIRQDSARLPDGTIIPHTPGQFAGFNWSDAATGPSLAQRLARLAVLYGLLVGDSGQGLDCTMTCDAQGHCDLNCS